MKRDFLQQKLSEFDKKKGTFIRLFTADTQGIQKLKEIAKNYDYFREPVRIYELINVLLTPPKVEERTLYDQLSQNDDISAYFTLMQSLKTRDLFNQNNFTSIYNAKLNEDPSNPGALIRISKVWELLSPSLQTQVNFDFLIQNERNFQYSSSTKKINDQRELDVFLSECLLKTYKKGMGEKIVGNLPIDANSSATKIRLIEVLFSSLPSKLKTAANFRALFTLLYDIQRGYNLDENFKEKDTNSENHTICTAGTFNKQMEMLWGIHKDVELKYITSANAALKIKALVPNVVNFYFYLQDLLSTDTNKERKEALGKFLAPVAADFYIKNIEKSADKETASQIISSVLREGITPIWETIKPIIVEQMFDEFGLLYKRGKSDVDFYGLVETGNLVNLNSDFIAKLLPSQSLSEEKEQAPVESQTVITTAATSRRSSSFFLQPSSQAIKEEKQQLGLQSLSDWQDNFKKVLVEQISSVEKDDDKAMVTKLKILSRLLDQYPLDGIASVALLERNLSNTVKSIENGREDSHQDLSSHYSDCLNTLKKSLDGISVIK